MPTAEIRPFPHLAGDEDIFAPMPNSRLLRLPPRREWMIERCFAPGTVGMISGDGGIGKSLLMQTMLSCAVLGLPWLGLMTRPGRGLFFTCEDDEDEVHRRQWTINRSLSRDMEDLLEAGLVLMPRVGKRDNTLSFLDRKAWRMAPTDLFVRMADYCRSHGIGYVVIDTATQVFAGNQNDEQQVMQFINQLRRLAILIQGIVLLTKHPSQSGRALGTGESGNVAWNNSVRSRLYLHQDKARGLVLEMKKSNYGRRDLVLPLTWEDGVYRLSEAMPASYGE